MNLSLYSYLKPYRVRRLLWIFVNRTIFRVLNYVRYLILRYFGAELPIDAIGYSDSSIFALGIL